MHRLLALLNLTVAFTVGFGTVGCSKPEGGNVTVTAPDAIEIVQEGKHEVIVKVARTNFDADVTVLFDKIPSGVSVLGDTIAKGKDEGKFLLEATEVAKPGEYEMTITAKGGGATNTVKFKLIVKKGGEASPPKKAN
jgi:hypothetical protein